MKSSVTSAIAARERGEGDGPAGGLAQRRGLVADVLHDEDVEHHHRARVDDDLGEGDPLRAQQQEQRGEQDEMRGEREDAVERLLQRDHGDRGAERADRGDEEDQDGHQQEARDAGAVDGASMTIRLRRAAGSLRSARRAASPW